MSRRGMLLLLIAGVVAGGCSRDAPTAAPVVGALEAALSPSALAAPVGEVTAEGVDDALGRLLPALGDHGASLKSPLLRLDTHRRDEAARREVMRLLDQLDATLPAAYRADLDALRLELGVSPK